MKDKSKLIALLEKLDWLLRECHLYKEHRWWLGQLGVICSSLPESPSFQKAIKAIRDNLGGMGTLSDYSFVPPLGSSLNRKKASDLQIELIEKIGREIDNLKYKEPIS